MQSSMSGSPLTILGTGDFGRALAKTLLQAGYSVVFGSRHPQKRDLSVRDPALARAKVCDIEEAITASNIIFLALHTAAQQQLHIFQQQLAGKLLVDVSNVPKVDEQQSNAEKLQNMFPESHVVKAFNTLSAYTLMTGYSSLDVHIAGDHEDSVQEVLRISRNMGFHAIVRGKLMAARQLEAGNVKLFTGWGAPLIVASTAMGIWMSYVIFYIHIVLGTDWGRLPLELVSKVQGVVAITLLALCYLPGSIAAFTQLIHGTKHRAFPRLLDRWLKMRKQLGLLALWLASIHCIFSLPQISRGHHAKWFMNIEFTVPVNQTEDLSVQLGGGLNWLGQCTLAAGILSLGMMAVLGVTSLPSVAAHMNWRQWTFVQSYLGYTCLLLAAIHVSFISCPSWFTFPFYKLLQCMAFQSIQLPYVTLFLRLLLLLPCFRGALLRIRRGWERGENNHIHAAKSAQTPV